MAWTNWKELRLLFLDFVDDLNICLICEWGDAKKIGGASAKFKSSGSKLPSPIERATLA